jgi:hypothetical protein
MSASTQISGWAATPSWCPSWKHSSPMTFLAHLFQEL